MCCSLVCRNYHCLSCLVSIVYSYVLPIITLGLQVVFKTRTYHCNVDTAGNLIIDILNDSWSPALIITKVLLGIRSKSVFVFWEGDLRVLDHAGMHPLHMSPTAVANANLAYNIKRIKIGIFTSQIVAMHVDLYSLSWN